MTVEQIKSIDALQRSEPPGGSSCQPRVLARLVRGCFIKIRLTDHAFWAEVQTIHGNRVEATLRHLVDCKSADSSDATQWLGRLVTLTESNIIDTGCDTRCWC